MSFFEGKKRDLSDKSRNGEDTKKIRENSSNSLSDEIFEDGLNTPECVKIFFNCLKQTESDVKKYLNYMRKVKMLKLKLQSQCNIYQTNFMAYKNKIKRKMKRYLN